MNKKKIKVSKMSFVWQPKDDPTAEKGTQGWHWQKDGHKTPLFQKILWAILGVLIAGNIAIMAINTQHMIVLRGQSPAQTYSGHLIEDFKQ